MRKALSILVFSLVSIFGFASCDSLSASSSGGWKPMASAPRDGTVVEMLETYGVAPWYGRYKWIKKGTVIHATSQVVNGDNKTVTEVPITYTESVGRWANTSDSRRGITEDECGFWRPTAQTGEYTDPTGGAQKTTAYWCVAMHRQYDKKTDSCK